MRGRLRRRPSQSRQDTWELIVDIDPDPVTGKRRRRYKAFQGTRKQAEKALADLVQEVEPGSFVDPRAATECGSSSNAGLETTRNPTSPLRPGCITHRW